MPVGMVGFATFNAAALSAAQRANLRRSTANSGSSSWLKSSTFSSPRFGTMRSSIQRVRVADGKLRPSRAIAFGVNGSNSTVIHTPFMIVHPADGAPSAELIKKLGLNTLQVVRNGHFGS
jgi:hypothetical protein